MEKDLFQPIKSFFETQGYVCDGEVNDIDLYMEKDGESVAVELKVSFDFKALQQAALRQKTCDSVYIGIFTPNNLMSHSFKDKIYLLKRLGIGLITVSKKTGKVSVITPPVVSELTDFQKRNKRKKQQLSKEFHDRRIKTNTGGVTHTRLLSSYRENALLVLDALCELGGEATTKKVLAYCNVKDTTKILYDNYYGWFENVQRGTYRLTEKGYEAFEDFEAELYALRNYQKQQPFSKDQTPS